LTSLAIISLVRTLLHGVRKELWNVLYL
jgi:hypothetical protein